jgi:hypothetical protein
MSMSKSKQFAELQYSSEYHKIELVVPYGTKIKDFAKVSGKVFGDLVGRLPRGCENCFSGEDFNIRERLEHVLFVDLESMQIVERQ